MYNTSKATRNGSRSPLRKPNSVDTNFFDDLDLGDKASSSETLVEDLLNAEEHKLLDRVAEDLARLGRVKRVGLAVKEKDAFLRDWTKKRR